MARRPLFAALLLASLSALALAVPAIAPAAYPGGNGELLFTSTQHGGVRHIFLKTTAGTKDLTGSTSSAIETEPEFSPDGTKIVFTRLTSGLPNTEIFVMNANGTNRHALTNTATGNTDATWSPDGKRIAFVSQRNGVPDIYVMNADGTQVHQITHSAAAESDLNWGTTGRIAFVRVPGGGGDRDIYSIRPDGTGLENLTNDPTHDEVQPDYSPGGYQIVYTGTLHPAGSVGSDLWIMNANGTNPHPLQHESNGYSDGAYPAWSPSGSMIAFVANNGTGHPGIWKVPASGGTNIQVLQSPLDEDVNWQPTP